jgi:peptide-methionine (S)-S-oxide reductase
MKSILLTLLPVGALSVGLMTSYGQTMNTNQTEFATFGGGCFWCMEAEFQKLPGIKSLTSGFSGGRTENPTYEQVCSGTTGHAEVIQIGYDPTKVSYERLLQAFWIAHDPTTSNRQGADEGTQYRSIILYRNEAEKLAAEKSKAEAQKNFSSPIVTELASFKKFYPADDHHQNYFNTNPNQPYCQVIIKPKLEKFEKELKKVDK